jgi:hypothetical protein
VFFLPDFDACKKMPANGFLLNQRHLQNQAQRKRPRCFLGLSKAQKSDFECT